MKIKYLLITTVLTTAILCSGGAIKAQATDISTQIAQLMAQIASLQAQLAQLQAQQGDTITPWCHTFNANIGVGQKIGNPEIDALITVLQKEGILSSDKNFNNGYDETLASSVSAFQQKYASEVLTPLGLKYGTGFLGKATRAKLNALYGCSAQSECTTDADCPSVCLAAPSSSTLPPSGCLSIKCIDGKCVSAKPNCTPKWTCGWGECKNGYQSQVATDFNNCGLPPSGANIACPALAKVCAPSTQPSITVTSPNGGSYNASDPLSISWTGYTGDFDYYYVILGNKIANEEHTITPDTNVSKYNTSLVATNIADVVKEMVVNSGGKTADQIKDNYYIVVDAVKNDQAGGNVVYRAVGNVFSINFINSTQPSITVTSPNGGETVLLGTSGGANDFRTTWTSSNLSGNVSVYLNLADGRTCLLGTAPVSQGYFLTTLGSNYQCPNISSTVTSGQYKVLLNTDTPDIDPNSLFGIHDSGDNYFSIVVAQPSITCNGLNMVWYIGSTEFRREPYDYTTDQCVGYRCLTNNTISPSCYNQTECASACSGQCINIFDAKNQCSVAQ